MTRTILSNKTYDSRWEALDQRISDFIDFVRNPPSTLRDPDDFGRTYAFEQLHRAAVRLRAFANSYLGYFDDFRTHRPPDGYTPEYAIALGLHQIGCDMEVLEQAAQQRLGHPTLTRISAWKTLYQADVMARGIIEIAKPKFPQELAGTTALVYFQKSPRFHGMPYAPLALTAIPYSAIRQPQDLLATPHELGHYVYQSLKNTGKLSDLRVLAEHSWVGNWTEEIFADVFGYLVGGPMVSESLQELLLRHSYTSFATANFHDTHPTPILRPFIYNLTLGKTKERLSTGEETAVRRWNDKKSKKTSDHKRKRAETVEAVEETVGSADEQILTPLGLPRPIEELISTAAYKPQDEKPVDYLVNQILTKLGIKKDMGKTDKEAMWQAKWAPSTEAWGKGLSDETVDQRIKAVFYEDYDKDLRKTLEPDNPRDMPLDEHPWQTWLNKHKKTEWLELVHAEDWIEKPPDNWPKTG